MRVTHVVDSRPNAAVVEPRICIVNGLDHHGFTPAILFLDRTEDYLIRLTAPLVVRVWFGRVMPVVVLLMVLHLPWLLLLVLLLVLLLLGVIPNPPAVVTLALPEVLTLLNFFARERVGPLWGWSSGL